MNALKLAVITAAISIALGCGKSDPSSSTSNAPASNGAEKSPEKQAELAVPPKPTAAADGLAGSCDYRAVESTCAEYMTAVLDNSYVTPEVQQQMCEANKGVWSTAHCPTEKKLGACTDDEGYIKLYYAAGKVPFDPAGAKGACYGKWEAAK